MFKAPDSVNAKSTASARDAYVKFHDNGQIEFNATFYEYQLISRKGNTYFNVQWQPTTQIMIIAFASEAEITELGVENLEYEEKEWRVGIKYKDHQCKELGEDSILWRLKEGDLKKGLTGTIRSCNKNLYPEEGDINVFTEGTNDAPGQSGNNLIIHQEEKYVELLCKNKKTQPSQSTQEKLDEEAESKAKTTEEEEITTEMQEAYLKDDTGDIFEKLLTGEKESKWRPYLDNFLEWAGDHESKRAKIKTLKASFRKTVSESFGAKVRVATSEDSTEGSREESPA